MAGNYIMFVSDQSFILVDANPKSNFSRAFSVNHQDITDYLAPLERLGIPVGSVSGLSMTEVGLALAHAVDTEAGEQVRQQMAMIKSLPADHAGPVMRPCLPVDEIVFQVALRKGREDEVQQSAPPV